MNKSSIKKILKKKTFPQVISVLALFVSIIAVLVTIQTNRLTKEANQILIRSISPKVDTLEKAPGETITITGCHTRDNKLFYIYFYLSDEFTFTNNGNRKVSLYNVRLQHVENEYSVRVYDENTSSAESSILPLEIEPGSVEKVNIFATREVLLVSEEEVSNLINSQIEERSIETEWYFEFSDESSIAQENIINNLSINPNLGSIICDDK